MPQHRIRHITEPIELDDVVTLRYLQGLTGFTGHTGATGPSGTTGATGGAGVPLNDNLPNAIPFIPSFDGSIYTWEGEVEGTNVGATLDSAIDPINYPYDGLDGYGATVWYRADLPLAKNTSGLALWVSCDFDCRVRVYRVSVSTGPASDGPDYKTDPVTYPEQAAAHITWPTNAAQLTQLVSHSMYRLRTSGTISTGTALLTLALDRGWYVGAPIEINGAGPAGFPDFGVLSTSVVAIDRTDPDAVVLTLADNAVATATDELVVGGSSLFDDNSGWTYEGNEFNAGTDGRQAWIDNFYGGEGAVTDDDGLTGCPVYIEVGGYVEAGDWNGDNPQQGTFTLFWRSYDEDALTTTSLF